MATGSVKSGEGLPAALRDLCCCSQCQMVIEYMEEPCLLPCLHPICLECLEKRVRASLRSDEVECPQCTMYTRIPPGGLRAFPLATFPRVAKKTLTDENFKFVPGGSEPRCGIHPGKFVTDYCSTCRVMVCEKCISGNHRDHAAGVKDMADEASRNKQRLTEHLHPRLDSEITKTTESMEKLEEGLTAMRSHLDGLSTEIRKRADLLRAQIEKDEERNLAQLSRIRKQQESAFQREAKKLNTVLSALREYKTYVNILEERGKKTDWIVHLPSLEEKIEATQEDSSACTEDVSLAWHSDMVIIAHPASNVGISNVTGEIITIGANLCRELEHEETIPVACKEAYYLRYSKLFDKDLLLHTFYDGENVNKLCIHNTKGNVQKVLTINAEKSSRSLEGDSEYQKKIYSPVVVDGMKGTIVIAEKRRFNKRTLLRGALRWLTLSNTYELLSEQVLSLQCAPSGYINVSNGHVLALTTRERSCGKYSNLLHVFHGETRTETHLIPLPDTLDPKSAVMTSTDMFIVVGYKSQMVWVNSKGNVLRKYSSDEKAFFYPEHIISSSDDCLLVTVRGSDAVDLLSPNGTFLRRLLCEKRGIVSPFICYLDEQAGIVAVESIRPLKVDVFKFTAQ